MIVLFFMLPIGMTAAWFGVLARYRRIPDAFWYLAIGAVVTCFPLAVLADRVYQHLHPDQQPTVLEGFSSWGFPVFVNAVTGALTLLFLAVPGSWLELRRRFPR
ncbi:hypothetical protein KIH74_03485 [Kineosporia sp. J2-2]|uniref:Uncharacterized protein n=1 Tax=Kineosporia corallincola TaxID=2835133 RepID=A0ABS5TA95_9ACTN|nr:hypothetical protein [Kineosporia corallincola]MBT0767970.1 hypothetical protein [Kineosporia corallincola]